MNFSRSHETLSQIVKEVQLFGEARLIFDPNTLHLDQLNEGIYEDLAEIDVPTNGVPDENSMIHHFKKRSFTPKLLWNKCPRPAGISTSPWDTNKLYITTTDSRSILIFNIKSMKLVGRLTHSRLSYPCGVAFSLNRREIYVSDKWMHCVHVFSAEGVYCRSLEKEFNGPEGIAVSDDDELVICDTGNDRVLIIDLHNDEVKSTLGIFNRRKSELCMPTGVAIDKDRIIVADAGNNRIKVYDKKDGKKLLEFGGLGRDRGQFRSAEVVAIAPHGFILVGDAGNARIQVFKCDGQLVKILGGENGGFRWISGLFVTNDLDIVATDNKSRSLRIF